MTHITNQNFNYQEAKNTFHPLVHPKIDRLVEQLKENLPPFIPDNLVQQYVFSRLQARTTRDMSTLQRARQMATEIKKQILDTCRQHQISLPRTREDEIKCFSTLEEAFLELIETQQKGTLIGHIQTFFPQKSSQELLSLDAKQLEELKTQADYRAHIQQNQGLIQTFFPTFTQDKLLRLAPDRFDQLLSQAQEKKGQQERQHKVHQILGTPLSQVEQYPQEKLQQELDKALHLAHLANQFQEAIDQLLSLADETFQENGKIVITFSGKPATPFTLKTQSRDVLSNYTLFDFLRFNQVIPDHSLYALEESFNVSAQDLEKLTSWATDLFAWSYDFRDVFRELLGQDIEHVCEMAQKPVSELTKPGVQVPYWNPNSVHILRTLDPKKPLLLMNTLSLNLNPLEKNKAVYWKNLLENVFTKHHLQASNGQKKTFLQDDPLRTNLGINQIRTICPYLNKLAKYKQLICQFTDNPSLQEAENTLKNVFEIENQLQAFQNFKTSEFYKIYKLLKQPPALQSLEGTDSIEKLEGKSLELFETLLTQYTNQGVFSKQLPGHTFTTAQIDQLYQGNLFKQYRGNVRHKNLPQLFDSLRRSRAVHQAITDTPPLLQALETLETQLIGRLDIYNTLPHDSPWYGRNLVDETVKTLEIFVAKIVHQDLSKVQDASIERALITLVGTLGQDMSAGCERGLLGRINNMLLTLSSTGTGGLEDHLMDLKRGCIESAFQKVCGSNTESSMADQDKQAVMEYLQVLPTAGVQRKYLDLSHRSKQIVQVFTEQYTSVAIYHAAREYIRDRFWNINLEGDDEAMYSLMDSLQMSDKPTLEAKRADLDKRYRVAGQADGRWQYAFFQQDMAYYLLKHLIEKQYLGTSTSHLFVVEGDTAISKTQFPQPQTTRTTPTQTTRTTPTQTTRTTPTQTTRTTPTQNAPNTNSILDTVLGSLGFNLRANRTNIENKQDTKG